jgi:hypothetical protein
MAFTDLPDDWDQHPITTPTRLPDVLDLIVSDRARRTGALYLVFCDPTDRLLAPTQIEELPPDADPAAVRDALAPLLDTILEVEPGAGVLAALARSGGLSVTRGDESWAEAVAAACAGRLPLLGVHVVTTDGSRPVPRQARAA